MKAHVNAFFFGKIMKRYEIVKEYVYRKYNQIYNLDLKTLAFTHTNSVDICITMLAMARNLPIELAKIAALLHDFSQFVDNCPHDQHAKLSSLEAYQYLTSLKQFKIEEIDEICFAIAQHSKKSEYHSPLCEVLKDADILAHFFNDLNKNFSDIERQRLLDSCSDLSLM